MKLSGKIAIVTGGGRGIGRAIAEKFASEEAKVALVARTASQLEETAAAIREAGGSALSLQADVVDKSAIKKMVDRVESELGPVDILVNNAGIHKGIGPSWEIDPDIWLQEITVNVFGVFNCCRAVLPGMISRNQGRIINMIGGGFSNPSPYFSGYGTSKAAVMRFTETLAAELKESGIKVFAMGPGLVKTALNEENAKTEAAKIYMPSLVKNLAEGRHVPPSRAAELATDLASGRFDALTGRVIHARDDLQQVEANIENILENDLKTLRLKTN